MVMDLIPLDMHVLLMDIFRFTTKFIVAFKSQLLLQSFVEYNLLLEHTFPKFIAQ